MRALLGIILSLVATTALAATLEIDTGHGRRTFDTATLLGRSDIRTIDVPGDIAYHRTMRYRAVPLRALLGDMSPDAHLQFVAMDGFAAEIPAALLLNDRGAEPWLAVETPTAPWPKLGDDKPGGGPFYLVWLHPERASIGPEQWPYQIASIRTLTDPASRFPAMRPDAALPRDSAPVRGFAVFQHYCLACHTLNGQGDAKLGPDLNMPHSPTEYFREDTLRSLIRDPSSLRRWPQSRMPGVGRDTLSDGDLDALIAYLRHMAGRPRP
ncbi:mono/diheme cytochrome c family protein [Luteibacter rhizovicinus]|uniref:Mono/diheme cytochrome c family protein n=1 Tax=Luteibacter rhizovicinus TaxID=242606 RepID=A0A4R3YLX4_9GAMM|nr:cytochrome c [Luteibacter rhizovicinus]TCV93241.1 mono/diheme cytochrome c family protein [Luteibacter rhizovicinus]